MKSWRPQKWEEIYNDNALNVCCRDCFEVGAEAMLKALCKMAKESPTGTFVIDSNEVTVYRGKE